MNARLSISTLERTRKVYERVYSKLYESVRARVEIDNLAFVCIINLRKIQQQLGVGDRGVKSLKSLPPSGFFISVLPWDLQTTFVVYFCYIFVEFCLLC